MSDDEQWTREETIKALTYITNCPPPRHGGFDEKTVEIAENALRHLKDQENDHE